MPRRIKSENPNSITPLVVSPREAQVLLGVGRSYLYELLKKGQLDFYKEGTLTRITRTSIDRHIASRLAGGGRLGRCNAQERTP